MTNLVSVSARLNDVEREIIKKIQAANGKPGLAVSQSDAIKLALHFWEEQNRNLVGKETSSTEN